MNMKYDKYFSKEESQKWDILYYKDLRTFTQENVQEFNNLIKKIPKIPMMRIPGLPSINIGTQGIKEGLSEISKAWKQIDWSLVNERLAIFKTATDWAEKNLSVQESNNLMIEIDDALMKGNMNSGVVSSNLLLSLLYNRSKKNFILTIHDPKMDNKSANVFEEKNDPEIIIISTREL